MSGCPASALERRVARIEDKRGNTIAPSFTFGINRKPTEGETEIVQWLQQFVEDKRTCADQGAG